jgi:uncharacterized protein YbjT (DUF2867 family)
MILVTGATGNVGGALLRQLSADGHPVRALVRTPEKADDLRGIDCETAVGDLARPESLDDALRGVDAAFLVTPGQPDQPALETAFLDAAGRSAERPHVVKLAAAGFGHDNPSAYGRNHAEIVDALRRSGLPHTVIAPSTFMSNLLFDAATVQSDGAIYAPAADAAIAYIHPGDIAAVAAHVLAKPGPHDGATYVATGPEALTYHQIAEKVGRVAGREVRYVPVSPEQARSAMLAAGMDEWQVDALLGLFQIYRAGLARDTTDEVSKATGRPARSLDDFLAAHAAAFRSA